MCQKILIANFTNEWLKTKKALMESITSKEAVGLITEEIFALYKHKQLACRFLILI